MDQKNENKLSVCILASGSKGNATYISNGATSILIDAGLSGIEIQRRMDSRGLSSQDLDAIVVSHEHSDHVRGVGVLSRRFNLPVYVSRKTRKVAPELEKISNVIFFECGETFNIDDMIIHPFSISHDAEDPTGFTIKKNGAKIGIATDLGVATSVVKQHLKNCSLLILEANHDPIMLEKGPYPWSLKQRVKGRTGHLSNSESRDLLTEVNHNQLKHVYLAHLSEKNNTPEKALTEVGLALTSTNTSLSVASQNRCGDLVKVG